MRVVFMGTPDYADTILKHLIDETAIDVVAVFTQPDKPVGRKKTLTPPPVKTTALAHGITVHQPARLRDETAVSEVTRIACDFIVVAAYGQILPKAILEHAPCINLHASILPQYRGASPIQQSLLNGDEETGVSAMLMDEGLDTGSILRIERTPIDPDETAPELFERLTRIAADMTPQLLCDFDTLTPVPQDDVQASYCKKITKADGLVAFDDARTLYNRYRAFLPWPGVYLASGLKLTQMTLHDMQGEHTPGKIWRIDTDGAVVGCKKGSLKIISVQPPSKKAMAIGAYLNGRRLGIDDMLA